MLQNLDHVAKETGVSSEHVGDRWLCVGLALWGWWELLVSLVGQCVGVDGVVSVEIPL